MVHILGMVACDKLNADNLAFDWALEAGSKMKKFILKGDHKSLIDFSSQDKALQLSFPTQEHYLLLLFTHALKPPNEK